MQIVIDTEAGTLTADSETHPLYSKRAFQILSHQWLKVGWNEKYPYTFSWLGRPVIQLPEDLVRIQEVVHRVSPDVIIETGVAHGGGLVFFASLLRAMGKDKARVVGVDVEIRPHNRAALEDHFLKPWITLVEGSSTDPEIAAQATACIRPDDVVLVVLDSDHSRHHVARELELYSPWVTPGSYIVATDGSMRDLHDVPRGDPSWRDDHPAAAAAQFVARHPEFVIEQPEWPFNESELSENLTHWPDAYLRRVAGAGESSKSG